MLDKLKCTKYWDNLDKSLPQELVYRGEFGIELSTFIPFIFTLNSRGLMKNRTVSTYVGMKPYYYFLDDHHYVEKSENRYYVPPQDRWWPNSGFKRRPLPCESYPDYQAAFEKTKKNSNMRKKVIFVQNKFCIEWNSGPINYLPLLTLEDLFRRTSEEFEIVYSREAIGDAPPDYALDDNTPLSYPDLRICQKFSHVTVLELQKTRSYNDLRLRYIADSYAVISVQGGGSYTFAYFDKPTFIFHRRGVESLYAYRRGIFSYMTKRKTPLYVSDKPENLLTFSSYLIDCESTGKDSKKYKHLLRKSNFSFHFRSRTYMRAYLGWS